MTKNNESPETKDQTRKTRYGIVYDTKEEQAPIFLYISYEHAASILEDMKPTTGRVCRYEITEV